MAEDQAEVTDRKRSKEGSISLKTLWRALGIALGFSMPLLAGPSGPPAGNYINLSSKLQAGATFYVSSGTIAGQLTVGSCVTTTGASCGAAGGSTSTVNTAAQYSDAYYSAPGSSNALSGLAPGATWQALLSGGPNAPPIWFPVILATGTLQAGSTYYVSSGTVLNQLNLGTGSNAYSFTPSSLQLKMSAPTNYSFTMYGGSTELFGANSTALYEGAPLKCLEQAAPTGTSGSDFLWGDSTYHWPRFESNGSSADYLIAGSSTSNTATHLAVWTSNGMSLMDGGPSQSSNFIQNTSSLQSGATFYVSSGTAAQFYASTMTVSSATISFLSAPGFFSFDQAVYGELEMIPTSSITFNNVNYSKNSHIEDIGDATHTNLYMTAANGVGINAFPVNGQDLTVPNLNVTGTCTGCGSVGSVTLPPTAIGFGSPSSTMATDTANLNYSSTTEILQATNILTSSITVGNGSISPQITVNVPSGQTSPSMIFIGRPAVGGDALLDYQSVPNTLYNRLDITNSNQNTGPTTQRTHAGYNFMDGSGNVWVYINHNGGLAANATGYIRLYDGPTGHYDELIASNTYSQNNIWTLPPTDAVGCWQSDGAGNLSISACPGGGGASWGSITGTMSSQTDLWNQFTAVWTSTAAIGTSTASLATAIFNTEVSTGNLAVSTGTIASNVKTSTAALWLQLNYSTMAPSSGSANYWNSPSTGVIVSSGLAVTGLGSSGNVCSQNGNLTTVGCANGTGSGTITSVLAGTGLTGGGTTGSVTVTVASTAAFTTSTNVWTAGQGFQVPTVFSSSVTISTNLFVTNGGTETVAGIGGSTITFSSATFLGVTGSTISFSSATFVGLHVTTVTVSSSTILGVTGSTISFSSATFAGLTVSSITVASSMTVHGQISISTSILDGVGSTGTSGQLLSSQGPNAAVKWVSGGAGTITGVLAGTGLTGGGTSGTVTLTAGTTTAFLTSTQTFTAYQSFTSSVTISTSVIIGSTVSIIQSGSGGDNTHPGWLDVYANGSVGGGQYLFVVGSAQQQNQFAIRDQQPLSLTVYGAYLGDLNVGITGNLHQISDNDAANNRLNLWNSGAAFLETDTVGNGGGNISFIPNTVTEMTLAPAGVTISSNTYMLGVASVTNTGVAVTTITANSATINGAIVGKLPTMQVFLSGSGTYTTPTGVTWIRVRMVGGGGGGGGSGSSGIGTAAAGGNTTFGSNLETYGGNAAGNGDVTPGTGGNATLGTGPVGMAVVGGSGGPIPSSSLTGFYVAGGQGGSSALGGAGFGGVAGDNAGGAGQTNTGGGGGGASGSATGLNGSPGGGSGGFVDAIITSPAASYSYGVGGVGSGASAGTSGVAGGNGGSGGIWVEEHYN
jgi:hypothetical protein